MKKERIFYLDFIKALAVIMILITHYNAVLLFFFPAQMDKRVITYNVCNLYIGDFAVSLFLIISGAALMYVYEEKLELLQFYKKRFLGIFPMFWLGYIIAFLVHTVGFKESFAGVPKKRFILTILSADAYYSGTLETFYLIGEWFLSCIIILYILFPLLRWALDKYPAYLIGAVVLCYLLSIYCYQTPVAQAQLPLVRLPEFLFGMIYMKYVKKPNWKAALIGLVMLILNTVFLIDIERNTRTAFIGIMAFLFLIYASKFLEFKPIKKICGFLSKYAYAIFLAHHFIILKITRESGIDMLSISLKRSYALFAVCVIVSLIAAVALYWLDKGRSKLYEKIRNLFLLRQKGDCR